MSASGIEIPIVSTYKDKGVKAANKSLNVLTKSAKTLGIALGAYQTLKFGKSSIKAFADDTKAANQLSKTLQNLGQNYAVLSTAGFIQNLQNTTGVLDDQLRPAFSSLVNATLDAKKAQDLLSIALDTSAGTGANLQSVTDALSKAVLGENTALGKLGIGLTKAEIKTMDLDKITKYLSNRFQGQAKIAAESFAGKMDILRAKTEDAKEMIGKELVGALDAAFGDPEKYGSSIDSLASKISGLIKGFSKFILITKTGLQNPTLSPDDPRFESKLNLAVPFNPVSRTMDVKAYKEQLKLQAEAKKLAASRLAAIAKEKALVAEQRKLEADRKKLEQISSIFDIEQIQIYAALQNKVTDQEKLRLSLQLALIQENASEAGRLATELVKSQLQTTSLAEAIAKIPPALYPFKGWSTDIDNLIQQILLMMKLLSNMPNLSNQGVNSSSRLESIAAPFTKNGVMFADINPQQKMSASQLEALQKKPATVAQSEAIMAAMSYRLQAQAEAYNLSQGLNRDGTTIINVNGATQGLLDELRNGLINSSASGSFSTINPNR
jgi:hypothetical protein